MAAVFKAEHVHFHETCALKVINPSMTHDEAVVERFMREAFLTRRLRHPNAIRVDDIDRAEDGSPFMVMEFLEGQTLHEVLHYEGPLPYARVCTIASQVASALHAAHEVGIIHRDIKPANITILKTPRGDVAKVLDFGIAKLKEARIEHAVEHDFTLSVAGMVVGTPAYVSPEQAVGKRGSEIDARSDVYSFAVLVYQMLTNKLPVNADSEENFVIAHASVKPDNIRNHLHDLPPAVAELIMRCLSKDPNDRPWDPRELTDEMQSWDVLEEPATAKPAYVPPKPTRLSAVPEPPEVLPNAIPPKPLSPALLASFAAALGLFVIALMVFLHRGGAETSTDLDSGSGIQPSSLSLPTGDMILVPTGPAILGEHDQTTDLRAFYIDKTEVSARAYLEFCRRMNHQFPVGVSSTDLDLPIRNVSYTDAAAFAAWAHKRLPTASEWEKAARGTQGEHFPWGNDLGSGMARLPVTADEALASNQPQAGPAPVDSYPQGASSYGAVNMVGNVWEWVAASPVQIRGGSYQSYPPAENGTFEALVFSGQTVPSATRRPDIGFRCAR